jgi:hypothetical protein
MLRPLARLVGCAHDFGALELPGREAPHVKVECFWLRSRAITVDVNLNLQLISRDHFAAHRASLPGSWPAEHAVRASQWERPAPESFAGFLSEARLVGHGGIPQSRRQYRV